MQPSDIERFWSKVSVGASTECWLWTAGAVRGYGMFWVAGKSRRANRVSWELANGEIPPGMKVLHDCDTPACVNPEHLFLGSDADNMKDRDRKGRHGWARRTHCAYGHAYSAENTIWRGTIRWCRACMRRRNQQHYDPQYIRPLITCTVCGKQKPHKAHGRCHACNERLRRSHAACEHHHARASRGDGERH